MGTVNGEEVSRNQPPWLSVSCRAQLLAKMFVLATYGHSPIKNATARKQLTGNARFSAGPAEPVLRWAAVPHKLEIRGGGALAEVAESDL